MTAKRFRRLRSLAELRARLGNRPIILSISGGKDSTAMALWLRELEIPAVPVFCDTGWEHPETYRYLREVLPRLIGPVVELRGELDMIGWIRRLRMFPSRSRHWCTDRLKLRLIRRYLRTLGPDPVDCVGVRAEESDVRAGLSLWERERGYYEVWRPILHWPLSEVWAIHERHGCPRNPLYDLGATRVGCWPCVWSGRADLRLVADSDPDRISLIRSLEQEIGKTLFPGRSIDAAVEWAHDGPTYREHETRDCGVAATECE